MMGTPVNLPDTDAAADAILTAPRACHAVHLGDDQDHPPGPCQRPATAAVFYSCPCPADRCVYLCAPCLGVLTNGGARDCRHNVIRLFTVVPLGGGQ
jgi:hypothetical protein